MTTSYAVATIDGRYQVTGLSLDEARQRAQELADEHGETFALSDDSGGAGEASEREERVPTPVDHVVRHVPSDVELDGQASPKLVALSRDASPPGVVTAYRDEAGTWQPCDSARAHLYNAQAVRIDVANA